MEDDNMAFDYLRFDQLSQIGKEAFKKHPYTEYSNELRIDDEVGALVGYISVMRGQHNNMVLSLDKLADYLENFIVEFGEQLGDKTIKILELWLENGILGQVINEALFKGKSTIITSETEPENVNDTTYWYHVVEEIEPNQPDGEMDIEYDYI